MNNSNKRGGGGGTSIVTSTQYATAKHVKGYFFMIRCNTQVSHLGNEKQEKSEKRVSKWTCQICGKGR